VWREADLTLPGAGYGRHSLEAQATTSLGQLCQKARFYLDSNFSPKANDYTMPWHLFLE